MKQKDLDKFIETSTNEEGNLDSSKLFESVNMSFNTLRDKQKEQFSTEKSKWEENYNTKFYKDLGYENIKDTSGLKSFIDERKDFDLEIPTKFESVNKELSIYKTGGFGGDAEDLEYLIHKANSLIDKNEEDLSFDDAVKQLRESKASLFGAPVVSQTKTKAPKVKEDDDSYAAQLAKKYGFEL